MSRQILSVVVQPLTSKFGGPPASPKVGASGKAAKLLGCGHGQVAGFAGAVQRTGASTGAQCERKRAMGYRGVELRIKSILQIVRCADC